MARSWDGPLPEETAKKVTKWMDDFVNIKDFRLPRCIVHDQPLRKSLVGFSDASGEGIAAVVYLVSEDQKETISNFVKANTKTSAENLKGKTPRLELIGAVMLANLMTEVRKAYPEIPVEEVYYFTDSADVLYWVYSGASHYSTFVAHRIQEIRGLTQVNKWKHVSSGQNPADIPSRGCSISKLKDSVMWKYGPEFIRKDMIDHESTLAGFDRVHSIEPPPGCRAEMKVRIHMVSAVNNSLNPRTLISKVMNITDFSSYGKLIRTTVIVLRFINLLHRGYTRRVDRPAFLKNILIDPEDTVRFWTESELFWIRAAQLGHFPGIHLLLDNPDAQVPSTTRSMFFQHGLFLDSKSQVLCCSSRLQNSGLAASTVYPILLPSHSTFTELYIRHAHTRVGHQGVAQTLAYIRKEFWVLKGRQSVKRVLRRCNFCRRVQGRPFPLPPHPPLPDFRTQQSPAFSATGLDCTGPYTVQDMDGESLLKAYVLLLTCAATRCIHLEVIRSMAVDDVLLALERFFSFRGIPKHFESDNGTNFVRCNREIKKVLESERGQKYFDTGKIKWHFYTSKSPHMGGFIEKMNDVFKKVSRKTFGQKTILNFEEFRTMIAYSMAIVNDRPMTYVYSENCGEGIALSPNKLTLGHDVLEPPHVRFEAVKDPISRKHGERFAILENIKENFWNSWRDSYLTELFEQHISKAKTTAHLPAPRLGEVCLLKVDKLPRRRWKLCKVVGFKKPTKDEHIRQCRIKTLSAKGKYSFLNRSPEFLIPLEVEQHVVDDDPLLKDYHNTKISADDSGIVKPLPPFWTRKVKLPKEVFQKPRVKRVKNMHLFREKGKLPKRTKKTKTTKTKRVNIRTPAIDAADESVLFPDALPHEEFVANRARRLLDENWNAPAGGGPAVTPSTRVLRRRAEGLGIVIPGPDPRIQPEVTALENVSQEVESIPVSDSSRRELRVLDVELTTPGPDLRIQPGVASPPRVTQEVEPAQALSPRRLRRRAPGLGIVIPGPNGERSERGSR